MLRPGRHIGFGGRDCASEVVDEKPEKSGVYGSPEEMLDKAKTEYFVRDPERNLVYCPAGEILRQKCIKKNGISVMQTKMRVSIDRTEINVTREKASGKKLIYKRSAGETL